MPQVTATKAHRYGSMQRAPGDTYEIRDEHLRLYKALDWVSMATPAPVPRAAAAEATAAPAAPFKRGPGRPRKDERVVSGNTYARRDLVAAPPVAAPAPFGTSPDIPARSSSDEAE